MRKIALITLALCMSLTALLPVVAQQEETVTQAQLAELMADVLGLSRFLSVTPSNQEIFGLLMENGICPADGWKADEAVFPPTLARVVVQAMGRADEVKNPDDPMSWMRFLQEQGIAIGSVSGAVHQIKPSKELLGQTASSELISSDPLRKRVVYAEPDERDLGIDVGPIYPVTLQVVISVIENIVVPPTVLPSATPN